VFKLTTIYTRKNTEIDFYQWPIEVVEYLYEKYGQQRFDQFTTIDDSGLIRTDVVIWSSKDAYLLFFEDPKMVKWVDDSHRYRVVNEIETTRKYETINQI
jgi:hypothetical protein